MTRNSFQSKFESMLFVHEEGRVGGREGRNGEREGKGGRRMGVKKGWRERKRERKGVNRRRKE